MPDGWQGRLTRRELVGMAAAAAVGAGESHAGVPEAPASAGPTLVVAPDGSGHFGPNTPGTKTSGIQEAVDAAHARGGGTVLLRRGVYPVDVTVPPPEEARRFDCGYASILLHGDITLRGEGIDQTIIRTAGKCNTNALLGWSTSRVCIEDLTVDGAGPNAGYGIAIFGLDYGKGTAFSDVTLRRVKATRFGVTAIGIAGGQRVVLEQCLGTDSHTGFELGSPSVDYWVLHCTAYGCTNSTLIFDPADKYNEAGNVRPRIIGGLYDGEGRASGIALWDCCEPMIVVVTARRGVTTNIQITRSPYPNVRTPLGGGLIQACLADGSVGSQAGRYGIGAGMDGVRVVACSITGNEDVGVLAMPPPGGQVGVYDCVFRAGAGGGQRYAIAAQGEGVVLHARGNLHEGERDRFLGSPGALAVPGSCVAGNAGFNQVGLLPAVSVAASGAFVRNPHPYPAEVHLHSGRVTSVQKRDAAGSIAKVGAATNVSLRLEPGEAVAVTYTRRPEWSWFGL